MTRTPSRRMHLDRPDLHRYLSGDSSVGDPERIEAHLRSGCMPCLFAARELALEMTDQVRQTLRSSFFAEDQDHSTTGLTRDSVWLHRKVLLIELEAVMAPTLVGELILRPLQARREAVRKSRRYQILALSETLREESRREGFRDVARAV